MNGWKEFKSWQPAHSKKVIVFRYEKQKYIIAELRIGVDVNGKFKDKWVTEYSNSHSIHDKDIWYQFPELEVKKVYSVKE